MKVQANLHKLSVLHTFAIEYASSTSHSSHAFHQYRRGVYPQLSYSQNLRRCRSCVAAQSWNPSPLLLALRECLRLLSLAIAASGADASILWWCRQQQEAIADSDPAAACSHLCTLHTMCDCFCTAWTALSCPSNLHWMRPWKRQSLRTKLRTNSEQIQKTIPCSFILR